MSSRVEELLDSLVELAAVLTLPVGILAGLLAGGQAAGIVFVVGWLLVVPALAVIQGNADAFVTEDDASTETPLERLKRRYADGEIDEAEFERKLERLIATDEIPPEAVGEGATLDTDSVDIGSTVPEGVGSTDERDDATDEENEPIREP